MRVILGLLGLVIIYLVLVEIYKFIVHDLVPFIANSVIGVFKGFVILTLVALALWAAWKLVYTIYVKYEPQIRLFAKKMKLKTVEKEIQKANKFDQVPVNDIEVQNKEKMVSDAIKKKEKVVNSIIDDLKKSANEIADDLS